MKVDRWYSANLDQEWCFPADRPRRDRRPFGVVDMVEVERDIERCGFRYPWANQVCPETIPCVIHANMKCRGSRECENPVVGGCDHAYTTVCGMPVCAEHHNCALHGR